MGQPTEMIAERVIVKLIRKIEKDGRKAGLSTLAIQKLQQDCQKVLQTEKTFQI